MTYQYQELTPLRRNRDGTFRPQTAHDSGVELSTHEKKRGEPRKAKRVGQKINFTK